MTQVSVVIPMKNEAENIAPLVRDIAQACSDLDAFEVIVVDDGSTDETATIGKALIDELPMLRVVRHATSGGQSAAVHTGVLAANAAIICTLDGDGQNPASELPKLYQPLLDGSSEDLGLVAPNVLPRGLPMACGLGCCKTALATLAAV